MTTNHTAIRNIILVSQPTSVTQRHLSVDALRGFALLGILVVNVEYLLQPIETGWANNTGTIDLLARGVVKATSELKIYPIFAMLFGYGFSLQYERSGDALGPRYVRRMIALMALGVLHGILFFPGDILLLYGFVGLISYRFRNFSSSRLIKIAGTTYGIYALVLVVLGVFDGIAPATPDQPIDTVFLDGSFIDVAIAQVPSWIAVAFLLLFVQGPVVVASYCVGMAIGRTDLLAEPANHHATRVRALRWLPFGLGIGAIGAWVSLGPGYDSLGTAIGIVVTPLIAFGYVAGVVSLPESAQRLLQASGRMSLTVYLFESVIAAFLAMGYGLGWIGRFGPAGNLATAFVIWIALSAFAHLWMSRFRFGPLEWALRSISYGKRQPIRSSS